MWHVSSRSGVATVRTAIHLLLTYLPGGEHTVTDCLGCTDWNRPIMTPRPRPGQQTAVYCDVCLSVCVCLSVRHHIFANTRPIFTNFFVPVTYGRGSVLLWRRSDMLCSSGFTDDVVFSHKPSLLDVAAQLKHTQPWAWL